MTDDGRLPLFERLQVLDDLPPRNGPMNMALDETLLGALDAVPLLRVYRWERPAVSFGYFESYPAVAKLHPEVPLVRRWTGGGVVEHGEDLTYSLLVPRACSLTNLRAGESYRLIHLAVQRCYQRLGWGLPELSHDDGDAAVADVRSCFTQPVQHDLLDRGRKVGGAAQRRTRAGLLHQGSVHAPASAAHGLSAFAATLARTLSKDRSARELRTVEIDGAQRLAADKYASEAWLRLR